MDSWLSKQQSTKQIFELKIFTVFHPCIETAHPELLSIYSGFRRDDYFKFKNYVKVELIPGLGKIIFSCLHSPL
jgi:hypothetical protein